MQTFKQALVGLVLAAAAACHAQEIDKLGWLTGTWTQSLDGEVVQESWLGPRGKTMAAVNLTTSARRSSFELLRIVEGNEGLALLASPGGRAPVVFKLKELGERRVVFENLGHDFPQRVLYWMEADGTLRARIEGEVAGRARGIDWRFTKTPQ